MNMFKVNSVRKCKKLLPLNRYFSSALYITGDKATSNFAVLTPYLDLEERLQNREELQRNLKYRGITTQVKNLEDAYAFYKSMENEKIISEITRVEIGKRLNKLLKDPEKNEEQITKLKIPASISKKEYRDLKECFYVAEEMMACKILSLPNVLHPKTPIESDEILHRHLEKSEVQTNSNLDIAIRKDLLEYRDPTFVVLKDDAALFEYSIANYFQNFLLDSDFTQFSNCDFARSVVVEGCGAHFKSKFDVFTLDDIEGNGTSHISRNHLVGGASLFAFMAYFTKHSVQTGYIPLRLFSNGRIYRPVENNSKSLFNVVQSTGIQIFIATYDQDSALDAELNSMVKLVRELYEPLGYHFRLTILRCNQLEKSESLRVSIQMHSPHLGRYVEVGNVSVYDKYLSKRLLFTYSENKERKFFKVISGNILNVQKLLGCVLENNDVNNCDLLTAILKQNLPL